MGDVKAEAVKAELLKSRFNICSIENMPKSHSPTPRKRHLFERFKDRIFHRKKSIRPRQTVEYSLQELISTQTKGSRNILKPVDDSEIESTPVGSNKWLTNLVVYTTYGCAQTLAIPDFALLLDDYSTDLVGSIRQRSRSWGAGRD
mmetsp:Transcript_23710/g.42000  ORF Transcript_23710/g.42000 Transcript_23710/m.42000 type:complete len:146 (+) Transcript_23710:217-654(+)